MASASKYFMIASSALSCDYGATQSSILRRTTCQLIGKLFVRGGANRALPRNLECRCCNQAITLHSQSGSCSFPEVANCSAAAQQVAQGPLFFVFPIGLRPALARSSC